MFFITFGISSLVAFHWDGLNHLGGSVTKCMISGNQLWSGQKGVIMIRPLPFLLDCPGMVEWCLEVWKHTWDPLATCLSRLLPRCSPVWEIQAEMLGQPVCLTACKQNYYWRPQHLNNLWLAVSPKLHSTPKLSCPCIGHMPGDLPYLWGILTILLPHSCEIWARSSLQDHLGSCNESSLHQHIGHCHCVVCLEGDSLTPHCFLKLVIGHPHFF